MYMAPELIAFSISAPTKVQVDGCKCDIYSMGIMFAKIANPKAELYEGMGMVDILETVVKDKLRPLLPQQLPHTISKLLLEMWSQDATQRPCISHVVFVLSAINLDDVDDGVGVDVLCATE
jgi:hypothetical protein